MDKKRTKNREKKIRERRKGFMKKEIKKMKQETIIKKRKSSESNERK